MRALVLGFLAIAAHAQSQSVSFQWVRQIGGSAGQSIVGIANDAAGNIYAAGNTSSFDFPVVSPIQSKQAGAGLVQVDSSGQARPIGTLGLAYVSLIAADPSHPQTIYVSDAHSLLRSTDAGASWTALAVFDAGLQALAVDPTNGSTLYAATAGQGLLKSTDAGATWTPINAGIPLNSQDGKIYAWGVWVDPNHPSVVFANTAAGFERSADGGATWQVEKDASNLFGSAKIAFDPNTPGTIYLPLVNSVLKSTDDGITWNPLPGAPQSNLDPTAILVDPLHPGTLYVGGYTGLWVTTDGGNTWKIATYTQVFNLATDSAGTIYYATYNALYASTDGVATSRQIGPNFQGVQSIAFIGGRVLMGTNVGSDVFITKLDSQGNVVYATYFGGTALDEAQAMAVDATGAVYVTGITNSSDFPVAKGAFAKSGASFLFKLNPDGSLAWSTYFAPGSTTPDAIAVDAAGSVYLSGTTGGGLPVTPGAYQTSLQGSYPCCNIIGPGPLPVTNGFLTKFDPSGSSLVFSTYFGAFSMSVRALALTAAGESIVAGGNQLWRFSADGSALLKSAAFPAGFDSLLVDSTGAIYAGGSAAPYAGQKYPVTAGAFETAPAVPNLLGANSGFVTKFDQQFNVQASTLLAGESSDGTLALASAANGDILAAGYTSSKAFPLRGSAQSSFAPATGFVTELTPDLSSIRFSTLTGDTRNFGVRSVVPAPDGGVLFAGVASPVIAGGATVTFTNDPGNLQSFVAKAVLAPAMPRIDSVVNAASLLGVGLTPGGTFVVNGVGFGDDAVLLVNNAPLPLLAHTATSLTAEVPLEFTAQGAVTVTVQSGGATSNSFLAPFQAAAPGIHSADGSGTGQAYVLNEDGTLNSPANPAKEGAKITIFATGAGHMTFTNGYAVTDAPPVVSIAQFGAPGIAATFGPVPNFPGDVYQISVYVPHPAAFAADNPNLANFVMPPTAPISLIFNGVTSQNAVTISIGQ